VSIINLFRSALDDNYETIPVSNAVAIREALPEVDFSNAVICVNGFQADDGYILRDNDICAIRLFPKDGPRNIAANIVFGFFTGGLYNVADLIVTGVTGKSILDNALDSWFKSIEPNANSATAADQLQSIPQLRGAKNQSNKNKPIPLVLGKHLYTPMYIGSPYTEIGGVDGEDQYFTALYLLGWGKLKVSDIRLGPVSGLAKNPDISGGLNSTEGSWSWDNNPSFFGSSFIDPSFKASNPQLELRQGASEVWLYPQKVVEERLNIELKNIEDKDNPSQNFRLEPIRFTAKNPQKVQVEITFNQGLISYDEQGKKKDASVGILIEWRANPNVDTWYAFGQFGTNGGQSPTQYNSSTRITTITRQKAKVKRFIAERSFTFAEVNNAPDRTIEIRVIRMTTKKVDDNRTADTVFLSAIRTWCFDNETAVQASGQYSGQKLPQVPMIQKYRDQTARLGFRIKATDNLQGTIDALNCIVESYARTWDGSAWSTNETPTNNPASVALKILQSPALGGNAYPDSMLDLDSFGEFYQWCADREYTCNGVLTAEKRVDDLLNAVLSTGRGMRILNGNRYAILIDKPRENPVMILNSQNVLEAKNEKMFEDQPDGFSVKFVNELDGYQETEVNVMADGSAAPGPTSRMESIEIPFVTDYRQIVKNGWYMLACRYLRPEIWHRKLSVDGYLIGIGSRVEVQDDTIVVGLGEGARIKGLRINGGLISEIQTDGEFDVTDIVSKQYGIKIMHYDGIHDGVVRTIQVPITEPGLYGNFVFNPPISLPFTPQEGDLVAFGEYSKITTPAICFGKKPNGDGTFEVTLIPYQEGIYTTDTSKPIPEYNAYATTPQTLPPLHEILPDQLTKEDIIELSPEQTVIFDLFPSVNSVKRNAAGVPTPDSLSCTVNKMTGTEVITDDRSKIIKYITSANSTEAAYTYGATIPIPTAQTGGLTWVELRLYDESIIIDKDRVPIVQDGAQGTDGKDGAKYLGKTYSSGTNSGVVEIKDNASGTARQVQSREGDCVAFVGTSLSGTSPWKNGFLVRWTGSAWEQLDPLKTENAAFYTAAMKDFLESGSDNAFLFAFIGKLFTKHIIMAAPGIIESDGFQGVNGNVNGYRLTAANGLLEAIGAILKSINVNDGVFNNMTVEGILDANVSILGGGAAPIVGAVREYIEFEYKNSSVQILKASDGIDNIERVSTGVYKLIPSYARYFTWDPVEINITGSAYETITIGSITNPPSVRCTGGLTVKNHSIEPELMGSGSYNWYINRNIVGFYTPSGQLRDPAIAMVLLIA
jgi:hypothetical protein